MAHTLSDTDQFSNSECSVMKMTVSSRTAHLGGDRTEKPLPVQTNKKGRPSQSGLPKSLA